MLAVGTKLIKIFAVTTASTDAVRFQSSKMQKATSVCTNTAAGALRQETISALAPIWENTSTLLYHISPTL